MTALPSDTAARGSDVGLEPFVPGEKAPWDLARVHHLASRAGFGATWSELQSGLALGHTRTLDVLLSAARTDGVPEGADRLILTLERSAIGARDIERREALWIWRMLYGKDPLGERLTLLWHDHFATSFEKVQSANLMVRQNSVLRENARAPFGDLLRGCVKDPALLIWLDAPSNYREHPNENLARELMELFTLGVGHYTESDVREVARALTGWRCARGRFTVFAEHHDGGEKRILGRRGTFDGDDVLSILLDEPATARRIAWRLASTFLAGDLVSKRLLDELALGLVETGLDVGRCVETILRSTLFFSDANRRTLPRAPIVHVVSLARALECFDPPARTDLLAEWSARAGQRLYHPPNVFGWPHGDEWMTTGALLGRAQFARALVAGKLTGAVEDPVRRLLQRHGVPSDAEAQVSFFGRLLLGQDPTGALRAALLATASASDRDACASMVTQLCTSPACQLG